MMVVVVVVVRMVGASVLQLSFGLQPILLGMSLRTTFLLDRCAYALVATSSCAGIGSGFIFGCVFVFLHRISAIVVKDDAIVTLVDSFMIICRFVVSVGIRLDLHAVRLCDCGWFNTGRLQH